MDEAIIQLSAVLLGGFLATVGGIITTLFIERRKEATESAHLALAFKGEISALLQLVTERDYLGRIEQVIKQIEQSGQPFYMPIRLHFRYDRVYENNVERIGVLKSPLPEHIPIFYTRFTSLLEDMVNLGEGAYSDLDVTILLRIYKDVHRLLEESQEDGRRIIEEIDELY